MMKKRVVLLILIIVLTGCTSMPSKLPKEDTPVVEKTPDQPVDESCDLDSSTDEAPTDVPVEKLSRTEYIRKTFLDYGFVTPDESEWIVKEEGPKKVAVIIKEKVNKGKPNISKLIFLEEETNKILFLEVNNKIIINR